MDGIECVRRLKEKMPDVLVIMLTVFEEEDLIFRRAHGRCHRVSALNDSRPKQLLDAIHELLAGGLADVHHHCAQSGKAVAAFWRTG
ncbi:MAG: hypothetical protein WDM76_06660 [Limisphaerales bacterium]